MRFNYPTYHIDLPSDTLGECVDIAVRLLDEVGMCVRHEPFRETVARHRGVRVEGERVYWEKALTRAKIEQFIQQTRKSLEGKASEPPSNDWSVACGGFSMNVIDIETDEVRPATCQDLRDLIRLVNSFGCGGNYPVMPQDLPPLMRAIACFKICWEMSDSIRPFDYQHISQTPFIYEMHQVMQQPFCITLCVPQNLMIDEKDIEIFLKFYPEWKQGADIRFWILDYPMLGITKPITFTGCLAMTLANMFGVHILFNLYDEQLDLPVGLHGGAATDLRSACWAWGHPRQHLFAFLNSRILARLCGLSPDTYVRAGTLLESSSSAVDAHAALEKTAIAMVAAFQGVRSFSGAGSLCVDDLFSGVQFVIDVEIVNYIRQIFESFDPPQEMISTDGLFEMLREVALGWDEFLSHPQTAALCRKLLPSSRLILREKLRSWMGHRKLLKDRAREEGLERLRNFQPTFRLPADKQRELERIYREAQKQLFE